MRTLWRSIPILLLATHVALGQIDQFAPHVAPPYTVDRIEAELVNYETQLIKPILVTYNGRVVVANEANATLDVYDLNLNRITSVVLGQGIASLAERRFTVSVVPTTTTSQLANPVSGDASSESSVALTGSVATPVPVTRSEIWVTMRHQQAIAIVNTINWRIKDWVRAPIPSSQVGYGDADHPGQVVFNAAGTKAYATAFNTDRVVVFDAVNRTYLSSIDLKRMHNGMESALNTPYSLLRRGNLIYVASHLSGNQTTMEVDTGVPGFHAPDRRVIFDLDAQPLFSLPDFDLMVIDSTTDAVVDHKSGVGSANFNMVYNPVSDRIVVTNLHHRNAEFLGEASWPDGRVAFSRLTLIDPNGPPAGPHQVVVIEDLIPAAPAPVNIVQPTDIVVDEQGRMFVAGFGSKGVGVFNATGGWLGGIRTADGPRGLVLNGSRLYVYSRIDNRVQWYDVAGSTFPIPLGGAVDLDDPTPETVKEGRRLFVDSSHSGFGSTSCASCHVDARKDGLAWDLSKFHDTGTGFTVGSPPADWQDRKGDMVTQDLRKLQDSPPYHWRGEQHDLEFFNGAFEGLLHGTRLSDDEFALFKSYVFSLCYPPNPFEMVNRNFTPDGVAGFIGAQNDAGCFGCTQCHTFPSGTNNASSIPLPSFTGIINLVPQLRGLWTKESSRCNIASGGSTLIRNMTGFGLLHNGLNEDSDDFIDVFFGGDVTRKALLNEFDTGLAPSAVYSEQLKAATVAQSRLGYLVDQANALNCDIAGRGRVRIASVWRDVGMIWDRGLQAFTFDDSALAPMTSAALTAAAQAGDADVILLGTPVHAGERIGVDIDRDGVRDADEVAAGLDPRNPDTDGDGQWDGYDLNPQAPSAPPSGPINVSNIQVGLITTTNSIKVTWDTDGPSPTRLVFGLTTAYGAADGDPFPISLAPNTSKLWKTHHTAFIRANLQDGAVYHFSIVTQGQNGTISQTPDATASTDPDGPANIAVNVRVTDMTLIPITGPPSVTWVANVTVLDNSGTPTPAGTTVRGIFTPFIGGAPAAAIAVTGVVTGGGGIASLSTTFVGQGSGDVMRFTIPQLVDSQGLNQDNVSRSRPILGGPGPYQFPEGVPSTVEVALP